MKNETYEMWKSFGFLDGLPEAVAIGLSEKYQELADFLSTYDKSNLVIGGREDYSINVVAFPILRKAYINGLNERYSPIALCEKIEKTFNDCLNKEIVHLKSALEIDPMPNICDKIAEYFSRNDKNSKPKL